MGEGEGWEGKGQGEGERERRGIGKGREGRRKGGRGDGLAYHFLIPSAAPEINIKKRHLIINYF
jgi:hypothetical protein